MRLDGCLVSGFHFFIPIRFIGIIRNPIEPDAAEAGLFN